MPIAGIETGAFGEGGDLSDGRIIEPRVFLEGPKHARDVPQLGVKGYWNINADSFVFYYAPLQRSSIYQDGRHVLLDIGDRVPPGDVDLHITTQGDWDLITDNQFLGQPPLIPPDNGPGGRDSLTFQIRAFGNNIGYKARQTEIVPAGKYAGNAGFYCGAPPQGQQGIFSVQSLIGGSASFQLVSADFTQIIDVTPPNCGTAVQGLVPIVLDSRIVFGRSTSFFPQVTMTDVPDFLDALIALFTDPINGPPIGFQFNFAPQFDCQPAP